MKLTKKDFSAISAEVTKLLSNTEFTSDLEPKYAHLWMKLEKVVICLDLGLYPFILCGESFAGSQLEDKPFAFSRLNGKFVEISNLEELDRMIFYSEEPCKIA